MQLDEKPVADIVSFGFVYSAALTLLAYIHKPNVQNPACYFPIELKRYKICFPQLFEEYNGLNTTLDKMTIEQRHGLKLTLLKEMKNYKTNTDAEISCEKLILDKKLPTDPDECLARINTMYNEAKDKIDELYRSFEVFDKARNVLHAINNNKRELTRSIYDEEYFSSMPEAAVKSKFSKEEKKPRKK